MLVLLLVLPMLMPGLPLGCGAWAGVGGPKRGAALPARGNSGAGRQPAGCRGPAAQGPGAGRKPRPSLLDRPQHRTAPAPLWVRARLLPLAPTPPPTTGAAPPHRQPALT